MEALVLDPFDTLVDAPTGAERRRAGGVGPVEVERCLHDGWRRRHGGTLPYVEAVATDLLSAVHGRCSRPARIAAELLDPERNRVRRMDPSVLELLESLRGVG